MKKIISTGIILISTTLFGFENIENKVNKEFDKDSLRTSFIIQVNDKDINLKIDNSYKGKNKFNSNSFHVGLDYLHIEKEHSNLKENSFMISTPFYYKGNITKNLSNTLGMSLNIIDNSDFITAGFNLGLEYKLPIKETTVKLLTNIDYSPKILSFNNAEELINFNTSASIEVIKNRANIIFSYKYISIDTEEKNNIKYNEYGYAGIEFIF